MAKLIELSKSFSRYGQDALFSALEAVLDLTKTTAPFAARKLAFSLLEACACLNNLSADRQLLLFASIIEPVDSLGLDLQVQALGALLRDGAHVEPTFASDLIDFLIGALTSQTEAVFDARKRAKTEADKQRTRDSPREKGLHGLLDLIRKAVSASPDAFPPDDVRALVEELLSLAERTTSKGDMSKAAAALGAVIRKQKLPKTHLKKCMEVSCAILNALPDLTDVFWEDVLLLLSTQQDAALDVLFSLLSLAPEDKHTHAICGAMSILHFLVTNRGEQGLPFVSFATLIWHLSKVHLTGRRTRRDCLRYIRLLLDDEYTIHGALEADWGDMSFVIISVAKGDRVWPEANSGNRPKKDASSDRPLAEHVPVVPTAMDGEISEQVQGLAAAFARRWPQLDKKQRSCVAKFHHQLKLHLSPTALRELVDFVLHGSEMLGSQAWDQTRSEIVQLFITGRDVDPAVCCAVFNAFTASIALLDNPDRVSDFESLLLSLMDDFPNHRGDVRTANCLAELATTFYKFSPPSAISHCLLLMRPLLTCSEQAMAFDMADGRAKASSAPDNIVANRLAELFMHFLEISAPQTAPTFGKLLDIAKDESLPADQRLPALSTLIKLRSDSEGAVVLSRAGSDPNERSSGTLGFERRCSGHPPLYWERDLPGFDTNVMKASEWLFVVFEILQQSADWPVYSYVLAQLPFQLSNVTLFKSAIPLIKHLRNVVTSQLNNRKFPEPREAFDVRAKTRSMHDHPEAYEVKRIGVDAWLVSLLSMLLGYSTHFSSGENDDIVRALLTALSGSKMAKKNAIHALTTCCYIIPRSLTKLLPSVLQKMSQIITQSDLAASILEFLGCLARLPEVYVNFREEEFRTVFAICVRYLEHSREKRLKFVGADATAADYTSNRASEVSVRSSSTPPREPAQSLDAQGDLPQYVFALAYHVLTIWFLSLKLNDRSSFVGWITKNLAWRDLNGVERMEEQSQVALDMMHRTAYLDLGETESRTVFSEDDGQVLKKTWIVGLSLCTVETAVRTGRTKLIKRQASGTTFATYQQDAAPLPAHHQPPPTDVLEALSGSHSRINIFPNHVFLQLMSNIAPMPVPLEPICLPDDEATKRSIAAFDRMDTVDGYRVGVIYVGNAQSQESEILGNTSGSKAFEYFLQRLGTKVPLKGARFNTQGLDRVIDSDGEFTIAWRDRIAEIVFHVPTLMPTDKENDPQCVHKKKHCGNNFVNIIFNESGLPWHFDNIPSQFNYVHIIITPENLVEPLSNSNNTGDLDADQSYFAVQTASASSFPEISPAAAPKLIPLSALAAFVRQLALHSALFCRVWSTREGGESISSWRSKSS